VFYTAIERGKVTAEGNLYCHLAMDKISEPSKDPEYFCLTWRNRHGKPVDLFIEYNVSDIEITSE
jgi:hypothetical protein